MTSLDHRIAALEAVDNRYDAVVGLVGDDQRRLPPDAEARAVEARRHGSIVVVITPIEADL